MQTGHNKGGLEYAMTQNVKKYKAKWEQQNFMMGDGKTVAELI